MLQAALSGSCSVVPLRQQSPNYSPIRPSSPRINPGKNSSEHDHACHFHSEALQSKAKEGERFTKQLTDLARLAMQPLTFAWPALTFTTLACPQAARQSQHVFADSAVLPKARLAKGPASLQASARYSQFGLGTRCAPELRFHLGGRLGTARRRL